MFMPMGDHSINKLFSKTQSLHKKLTVEFILIKIFKDFPEYKKLKPSLPSGTKFVIGQWFGTTNQTIWISLSDISGYYCFEKRDGAMGW